MKDVHEIIEGIVNANKKEDGTMKAQTFKRDDFEAVVRGILNTPDYKAKTAKAAGEGFEVVEVEVTPRIRKSLQKILIDFGVDKEDAKPMLDSFEFQKGHLDGIYELISESVYKYIEAGRKFNFLTKEDFQGSLLIKDVEAGETESRDMTSDDPEAKIRKSHKAHKLLVRKSKTPNWLKTRLD